MGSFYLVEGFGTSCIFSMLLDNCFSTPEVFLGFGGSFSHD